MVAFLKLLLKEISGKLLIIWDGAPIHRSKTIQAIPDGRGGRPHLADTVPAYAPELNPDEGIWHYLKHVELKNTCCADLSDLTPEIDNGD